jgi:hypothetical protein
MERLNFSAEEIEALSPENRELYQCLQAYTDSDSDVPPETSSSGRGNSGRVP